MRSGQTSSDALAKNPHFHASPHLSSPGERHQHAPRILWLSHLHTIARMASFV
ncbi:hypothetical protein GALMADRAFT_709508 [Galerina marginata CBS 339.88]|uniref:Uncharacterized protein n=1 Tax=Galerina marginata (strain CBS 339.88) TaxID=685588 RepID=A0A067TPW1_GALM3|nr:hypothetical protein GALMADRAFT_709508 [Galerina marginata CBS 339.88]